MGSHIHAGDVDVNGLVDLRAENPVIFPDALVPQDQLRAVTEPSR